jgi:hypothetical protein
LKAEDALLSNPSQAAGNNGIKHNTPGRPNRPSIAIGQVNFKK